MIKQMHLSVAPGGTVEFKGFSMAILARNSLLFDYLYTDFDTVEEAEAERIKLSQKKKGWFGK